MSAKRATSPKQTEAGSGKAKAKAKVKAKKAAAPPSKGRAEAKAKTKPAPKDSGAKAKPSKAVKAAKPESKTKQDAGSKKETKKKAEAAAQTEAKAKPEAKAKHDAKAAREESAPPESRAKARAKDKETPTDAPNGAISATPPRKEVQTMSQGSTSGSPLPKSPAVLRIAKGERTPSQKLKEERAEKEAAVAMRRPVLPPPPSKGGRHTPKVEINPKLQSSRGLIAPPEPALSAEGQKPRPMSVAEKNRAAAEAAFLRVAPAAAAPPTTPAPMGNGHSMPNGATPPPAHKSQFELRISERDTLTTTLRLTDSRETALQAARELAQRFQLPPDQALLVKVIGLGEAGLTKLALEELLELDDRGRVRRTPELRDALDKLRSNDRETTELKELLLEKIGGLGA